MNLCQGSFFVNKGQIWKGAFPRNPLIFLDLGTYTAERLRYLKLMQKHGKIGNGIRADDLAKG